MTKDEIIEMARETCFDEIGKDYSLYFNLTKDKIYNFAKLVAAKEREACAKVCEDREEAWRKAGFWGNHHEFREMAFAIRARGKVC